MPTTLYEVITSVFAFTFADIVAFRSMGLKSRRFAACLAWLKSSPAALNSCTAVRGRFGLVDDQHAGRAAACRLLVLIGPAAVIGHRLAAEVPFSAFEVRVIDEHHDELPANIGVLEVVPLPLGSRDAVAREEDGHVAQGDLLLAVGRRTDRNLLALGELHRAGG